MCFEFVTQVLLLVNTITIPSAIFANADHVTVLQIAYNFLNGSFSDADICRDIP